MFWLPSFLNLWTAAIAGAVAVPLLLLLYFLKLRRKEMPISSTLLWRKAIQDLQVNSPFQRLRRNLLLLLQLLLLLLLTLALARPVVNYTPGIGQVNVILIDHSASMAASDANGRSRLDEAKRMAKDLVSGLDRGAQAMVIAFDDTAQIAKEFTSDTTALKAAIDAIQPTDRRSRLKLAYQLAEAQTAFLPEQLRSNAPPPEVWLYSDGRVLDGQDLRLQGNLRYVKVGQDTTPNVAVVALSARRNYERPTELQVFARLANYGPKPVDADVQLTVDGRFVRAVPVSLAPERWSDPKWLAVHPGEKDEKFVAKAGIEFKLDLTTSAVVKVEQMHREDDALSADDAAQVVVPPPKPLRVLLVSDGLNPFMTRVVQNLPVEKPGIQTPQQYEASFADEKTHPGQNDVIIFDRYMPQNLPSAGNFIFFGAVPKGLKLEVAKDEAGRQIAIKDTGVLDWQRDHPILRHLSLGKLYVGETLKLSAPLETEVLIEGLKGPLAVLHREARSTYLVVGFNVMESNWPLRPSFPIFMANAMQFLALGSEMSVRQSYEPGATVRIPRADLQKLGDVKEIRIDGAESRRVAVPATGDFVLPALDKVGVYKLDPPVPQYDQIAVNLLDDNESNLIPTETPPGNVGQMVATSGDKSRLELWWWIVACAALPLLMIEWWVYTRRVHL